ncbi:DUF6233 domain-containing protein [Streptomyces lavendulocolor]|uniref:DUF6233 domain-containing protein n=1 Tax=Streptomyces lavendulocolor TaxID=67316 RepID=UPI003C2E4F1A
MSDLPPPLPPDEPRLAALETWLQVQLLYVREARAALQRRQLIQARTAPPAPPPYRIQRGLTAERAPVKIHLGDCALAKKGVGCDEHDARRAIVEGVEACAVCRPDNELGMLD